MIKVIIILFLCITSSSLIADEENYGEEKLINTSSDLNSWCKTKSSGYFLAKNITPYNWTNSRWVEGEFLYVEGTWKVGSDKYAVKCSVRKDVAQKYATWKLIEE